MTHARDPRSPAANRFAELVAHVYELAGELGRCGERIARQAGQSSARWKVLSAASVGGQTVAQLARRLGQARQGIQRVADVLEEEGLVQYEDNPDHQRSPRVQLTAQGIRTLEQLSAAAAKWENPLATRIGEQELERATRSVVLLLDRIRAHPPLTMRSKK